METILFNVIDKKNIKSTLIDLSALTFIYFVPALSHLFDFPVYFIEPMRIMLILALVHTTKKNSYFIALSLPLFSFLISAHPSIIKTALISSELVLNVWLFFILSALIKNNFSAALSSILLSKFYYYTIKFLLINFAVLNTELIATPVYLQIITSLFLSGYIYFMLKKKDS